jgi:hypothetical protein
MLEKLSRRALTAVAALAFAAGCAGNSSPVTPGSSRFQPSLRQAGPANRVIPGPAVAGSIVVPVVPHRTSLPHGWPAQRLGKPILFVADLTNSVVELYNPVKPNPSPEGSITNGISSPAGVATDRSGTLYVANIGNSTITEYLAGQSSPNLTISSGLSGPYGIAVDSKGNVFASNLNNNTVVGYAAGQTSPFESIDFSSLGQPVGIGVDGLDNVWVACDSTNAVFEIPAGSSTPQNANLSSLAGPIGISFGKKDVFYVSNFSTSNVEIYQYGSTSPSGTITSGISGPTLNGFAREGHFWQSNQNVNAVGYRTAQTTPYSTITGLGDPLGIALWPAIKK